MANPLIDVLFDPATLRLGANLLNFTPLLNPEMTNAMQQIAVLVQNAAVANTWAVFANPTGQLADSIAGVVVGPYEMDLEVSVPYAWRMEAGFHGADSLGRVYDEAGKPYAMPALMSSEAAILQLIGNAMAVAFSKAGGK